MLSLNNIQEETKLYFKVIQGQNPEYPDQLRQRWYPTVAYKQRLAAVACSLQTFFQLFFLAIGVVGLRRTMIGSMVSPLTAYNAFVFGTFGAVKLSLPGVTTYLGVQVGREGNKHVISFFRFPDGRCLSKKGSAV